MQFAGMNYIAIVVAAIAAFAFGAVYYGVLSKQWLAAVGRSEADFRAAGATPFMVSGIAELVMAWVLAGVIGHLGTGMVTIRNGLISALFLWLGFVATTLVVNHAYQGAKRSLTLIDGGHWLGVLLVQGAIIGWFGL
jgi:Protein of unknown function (DUF1761)